MAKDNKINKYSVEKRAKRVAQCKTCLGSPPTRSCTLQGLTFNVCDNDGCYEIVGDYKKVGDPIKITKTVSASTSMADPNFGKDIQVDMIPGKTGFNNLEII